MHPPTQALLKRRTDTTKEAFREDYRRHGHLVLPWCISRGVVYYAQASLIPAAVQWSWVLIDEAE